MAALRIFPFNILMRAADPAAPAFMTAFVANMHPDIFPFVNLCRAKNRTDFIRTIRQTNIIVLHMKMRFGIGVKANKILLFFDRLKFFLFTHYFITFQARYTSRASLNLSFPEPRPPHIFFCFSHLDDPSTVKN